MISGHPYKHSDSPADSINIVGRANRIRKLYSVR
nr:MAG TPA: hypothetical protein [Caudoviricetes sp.]